jgi:hypothetical protein
MALMFEIKLSTTLILEDGVSIAINLMKTSIAE